MPILLVERAHALGHRAMNAVEVLGRSSSGVASWRHSGRSAGVRLSVAPARVGGCPTLPRDRPPPPRCSCSTATRWPTARSSRCRWRTSRPPPGQHTNAVYGFTSMLINVLRDEQPTHVGGRLRQVAADLPARGVRRVQGQAQQDARRVHQPAAADQEVLDALRIPHLKKDGYEADDIIATLATAGAGRGHGGADPHRRPRLLPAGHRALDRALPDARGLRPGADDAGRGRGASTACRPHRYPELAALVGETSDNLPGVPGVGPGLRRQVDQPVRRPRQRHHPRRRDHRQEGRGAARAPRRRDPQPPAQRAGPRPRPRARRRPTSGRSLGPPRGAHALRRARVPGAARPAASRRCDVRGRRRSTTPASSSTATRARRRRGRAAGWPTHAGRGEPGRRHRRRAAGAPAPARSARLALAAADGRRPPGSTPPRSRPRTTRRWPAWLADADAAQGAPRRQGPDAGARGARAGRCTGWSATPRWRRTSSGPTSAPTTSPT